jgi:hypothetical protein
MDVQTGTVDLEGGLTGSGNFSGAGAIQLVGTVNATINGTAKWSGGNIASGSSLTVNGAVGWSGGVITGSILATTPGGILSVSNSSTHDLPGTVFNNAGTVIWSDGQMRGGNNTVVNNTGLWNMQSDDTFSGAAYSGASSFTNSGTVRKTATTGITTLTSVSFDNVGTVDVQMGTIDRPSTGLPTGRAAPSTAVRRSL